MNIETPLKKFSSFINAGHERSVRAKKNIAFSLVLKSLNIIIQLLLVPLILGYLSPIKYGIWVTVGSVVNWFYFFDIGLGNGLRNKLAEALAKNEKELGRIYISTAYAALSVIVIILYLLFLITDKFINWQIIFNSPAGFTNEINSLIIFVFTFFSINFVVRLIGSVLNADQKSSINDLIYTLGNLISLLFIFILTKVSHQSLVLVGISIGLSTFLPSAAISIVFFSRNYKHLRPSFKFVKFEHVNELTSLGIKFFVMQIAAVVVFTTDNIIISQLFGPAQVAPYSIALKYFNIAQMGFSIIITPFWSAFTEAYTKNDFGWIKNIVNKLIKIWAVIVIILLAMLLVSEKVYALWIGNKVQITFSLSTLMALFVLISTWSNIFTFFINGVGKLRLSLITASINALLNIPLSIFLAKYLNLGINGVILGTTISLSIGAIFRPIQYYKIINKKDIGIWSK